MPLLVFAASSSSPAAEMAVSDNSAAVESWLGVLTGSTQGDASVLVIPLHSQCLTAPLRPFGHGLGLSIDCP